jgi:hypothetical protein
VLNGARKVAEPDIDELHLLVVDELQYLAGIGEHQPSLGGPALSLTHGCAAAGPARDVRRSRFPSRVPSVSRVLRDGGEPSPSGRALAGRASVPGTVGAWQNGGGLGPG